MEPTDAAGNSTLLDRLCASAVGVNANMVAPMVASAATIFFMFSFLKICAGESIDESEPLSFFRMGAPLNDTLDTLNNIVRLNFLQRECNYFLCIYQNANRGRIDSYEPEWMEDS